MPDTTFCLISRSACSFAALAAALFVISWPGHAAGRAGPVVTTMLGALQGVAEDGVVVFKGVPLGQAPVGDLRWADARPARAWSGILKADRFAPACMQPPTPFVGDAPKSEDCLYLNLWTQSPRPESKRPVLVQIYGGGFTAGWTSTPAMDGTVLSKKGLVVVNLPYRVGTLGYMAHPELTRESSHGSSGGYAMSDLVLGLRWIRDNIRQFGGDPANVTVSGCSAGGHMTSYLIASPQASGLFRRAIPQSGAQFTHGPENLNMGSLGENEQTGLAIAERLGAKTLAELRALPAERIVELQGLGGAGPPMARPSVDGYYLPVDPYTAAKAGKDNKVDLLTGWTSNEGLTFPQLWGRTTAGSWQEFAERFALERSREFLAHYPAPSDREARMSAARFTGDQLFGYQNYKFAQYQLRSGRQTWLYHFERPSKNQAMRQAAQGVPASMLAGLHCGNSIYTSGNAARALPLEGPPTDSDRRLAETLSSYWANFARTGNPNGAGLPAWPAYDGSPTATVLRINDHVAPGVLPSVARMVFLDQVFEARRGRTTAE